MIQGLITASFVAGLIPALILFVRHGLKTPWRRRNNPAGKALFLFFLVTVAGYVLSVAVLIFPDIFHGIVGQWVRIVVRFLIAGAFWFMLWVFNKAQRAGALIEVAFRDEAIAENEARNVAKDTQRGIMPDEEAT